MIDFNEIWDNDGFLSSCSRADAEHFYNAGQQAKIDELKKLRSLDEMEINQLTQANQVWQIKCDELKKKLDCCREENRALLRKLNLLQAINDSLVAYKNQLLDDIKDL